MYPSLLTHLSQQSNHTPIVCVKSAGNFLNKNKLQTCGFLTPQSSNLYRVDHHYH